MNKEVNINGLLGYLDSGYDFGNIIDRAKCIYYKKT
jgi:hypothetical protein